MGHTLITAHTPESNAQLAALLRQAGLTGCNKIPFGRTEHRAAADAALPHHVTVCHWGSSPAALSGVQALRFVPFSYTLPRVLLLNGCEDSLALCLKAVPDARYAALDAQIRRIAGIRIPALPHLTVDISKDRQRIEQEAKRLNALLHTPVTLTVSGLLLYQIWEPVRLLQRIPEKAGT